MRAITASASVLALVAMGFVACMSADQESKAAAPSANKNLQYATGLAKVAVNAVAQGGQAKSAANANDFGLEKLGETLRAAGICENFVLAIEELFDIVVDTTTLTSQEPNWSNYPRLSNMIRCVETVVTSGESATNSPGSLANSLADYNRLNDCICGGSGSLLGIYGGAWQGFSPSTKASNGFSTVSTPGYTPAAGMNGYQPASSTSGYSPANP